MGQTAKELEQQRGWTSCPRVSSRAHQALHEIMYAETRAVAKREIGRFAREYGAKYPKSVASLTVAQDRLLVYFDYPAPHWKHLRTTNPIEFTFSTVRLREGVTIGVGTSAATSRNPPRSF